MNIIELYRKSYTGVAREIWLLALISFINRAGSMVLPFLSLYLSTIKGYNLNTTGLIMMGYGVGSFFGNWVGGVLSNRVGPFRLQFLSLVFSAFAYISLLWLHSPLEIAFGLFITSLFADAFRPANMASVALLSTVENRSKAVGITRLAFNLGFTAGPALGGLIAAYFGYEWLFIIDAATCLAAGLFFLYFFFPQVCAEGKKAEKSTLSSSEKPHLRLVFKDKYFMAFLFLVFVYGTVFMQYFHTVPVFFKREMHLSEDYIGLLMALNGLLIVLIELPLIFLLERRGLLQMMALGTCMVGVSYSFLLLDFWVGFAWLSTFFFTLGEVFSLPFTTTVVLNRSPDFLRERYMALYGMAFSVCHIIAPAIGMSIADKMGFPALWLILLVLMLLTAIGYYRLRNLLSAAKE